MSKQYDAILMIGYGAPERIEDIRPFLQNVAKGRPIPPDRLEEVAHHYQANNLLRIWQDQMI